MSENTNVPELAQFLQQVIEQNNNSLLTGFQEIQRQVQDHQAQTLAKQDKQEPYGARLPNTPKGAMPDKFAGYARSQAETENFLRSLDVYFHTSSGTMDLPTCINMTYTFLTTNSPAQVWLAQQLDLVDKNQSPEWMRDWGAFKKEFIKQFGNPENNRLIYQEWIQLRQSTSVHNYVREFRSLLGRLPDSLPESIQSEHFQQGLKNHIRMALINFKSDNLASLMQQAEYIEDQMTNIGSRQPQNNRISTVHPSNAPTPWDKNTGNNTWNPKPVQPQLGPNTSYAPMDIDTLAKTTRRGPLTTEEKQRRRQLNLCLYCGAKGHMAANCPASKRRFFKTEVYDIKSSNPDFLKDQESQESA